ncbi:Arp2/3 complex, 34 kd subunit p34-Arc-domain-containing protein [Polychytrium aggregatum]|uniref:Arp2/3 complex, 34 kd subunit p34-Arc-domain-containing protein n=1 Tax=Polychytrium aggregatum TaxID=110093 RepID=UPI0022FE27AA|nr:Arp2/3 complex, 34 kd subunit p34-Arc-domain-containing protein [Polychytrium aggregatum]KAI9197417.1 Arp2/3 complex, 34 kd subunit p34-Arc-domain-containing protein [Polychytrium aggregatum]
MIILEYQNKIIEETFREHLSSEDSEQLDRLSLSFADFDGVTYLLTRLKESKSVLTLSMSMQCFRELLSYGAENVLARAYGKYLVNPESGYDITLKFDAQLMSPEEKDQVLKSAPLLKRNVLAAPFEVAFDAQTRGEETPLMQINYRDEEAIYIKGSPDRVTVVFSTVFKEETDKIFGKVFLQEFVDARRQPSTQNAPQVLYSARAPPLEIRDVPGLRDSDDIGYVTFVLFPRHFASNVREETISRIQIFRDYLHYHIKCSKSYMHSRLRTRVDSFLKVLNRAKPEKPEDQKEKKTISGRTFRRAA